MKGKRSAILFFLVIFSLVAIGAIIATGILKSRLSTNEKKIKDSTILGEMTQSQTSPTTTIINNRFVQETLQNTKETLSQKATEMEKSIVKTVEKEITNLTQSQIDSLKLQICRDWGVVTPLPTELPKQ